MKRMSIAIALTATLAVLGAACGGGQPSSESVAPASAPQTGTAAQTADITFRSEPDPPRMGDNTLEVMVMSGGQPVTDADVTVEFFMPAMPAMNMAEMRNTVPLKHEGGGTYRGAGNVMMAGNWDVTVMAMRGGQEIARRQIAVTAK